MSMTPEKVLKQIQEEAEKLRTLLSEVRGAQKDLQKDKRDFELAINGARKFIREGIDKEIGKELREQLGRITENVDNAIEVKVTQIFRRFNKLETLLFMGDDQNTRSLEELVVLYRDSPKGRKIRELFGEVDDKENPLRG